MSETRPEESSYFLRDETSTNVPSVSLATPVALMTEYLVVSNAFTAAMALYNPSMNETTLRPSLVLFNFSVIITLLYESS